MIGQTQYQVTARLDINGDATAVVVASCDYGERTACVSRDITDAKALAAISSALQKAMADVEEGLSTEATAAAYEALTVASKKGEKV